MDINQNNLDMFSVSLWARVSTALSPNTSQTLIMIDNAVKIVLNETLAKYYLQVPYIQGALDTYTGSDVAIDGLGIWFRLGLVKDNSGYSLYKNYDEAIYRAFNSSLNISRVSI